VLTVILLVIITGVMGIALHMGTACDLRFMLPISFDSKRKNLKAFGIASLTVIAYFAIALPLFFLMTSLKMRYLFTPLCKNLD
jgi:hypothetical protein